MKVRKDVEGLIKALKDNRDWSVREWEEVAEALSEIGEPAVEPLIQALNDRNFIVRSAAAWVFCVIKDPRAVEPLIQALKDEDGGVKRGAAVALGEINDPRAVEPLIQALKDDSSVRSSAADALEKIGWQPKDDTEKAYFLIAKHEWDELCSFGEAAVDPLIQALKDEDAVVRSVAARALGVIGDPKL